jgi:putative transcriptional regulator
MNKIKIELKKKNLTQKWLAEKLNTTSVSVNSWCQNKSQPSIEKLFKVAEILETKPSQLIKD